MLQFGRKYMQVETKRSKVSVIVVTLVIFFAIIAITLGLIKSFDGSSQKEEIVLPDYFFPLSYSERVIERGQQNIFLNYESPMTIIDLARFYRTGLSSNGWSIETDQNFESSHRFYASKGSESVNLFIEETANDGKGLRRIVTVHLTPYQPDPAGGILDPRLPGE